MIWVDYTILAVIGVSALISLIRGFVREALSLLGWIVAFWVAISYTDGVAGIIGDRISVPSLRLAVAFLALFVGCLLIAGVVNFVVGKLVEKTGLSGTDRVLGIVFGVARGWVIVALLVLLGGLTAMPQDPWWRESLLMKHFQAIARDIRGLLPDDVASHFVF